MFRPYEPPLAPRDAFWASWLSGLREEGAGSGDALVFVARTGLGPRESWGLHKDDTTGKLPEEPLVLWWPRVA
jgi:hypothetical protein